MIKGGATDQCDTDSKDHGFDCYEKAWNHNEIEMKLDGGKSIKFCSLLLLEDGDGEVMCTE